MIESIDTSLIDWSRAQFAMTAMYLSLIHIYRRLVLRRTYADRFHGYVP